MIKNIMKNIGTKPEEENDILSGFNLTSEEHSMDGYKANAKMYPALQSLVKQREPFFNKKIEAWKKLKENPNNPKARADFIDATNAISQIDTDLEKAYKKEASGLDAEQRKKWEAKAASPDETIASLKNFIDSMSKPEAKVNPHADEIVEIYKTELEKRNKNPNYRPEKVYDK